MSENPLEKLKVLDSKLFEFSSLIRDTGFTTEALPEKTKILIALAVDTAEKAEGGITTLIQLALKAGATKKEIAETIMIAAYITGVGCLYSVAHALENVQF